MPRRPPILALAGAGLAAAFGAAAYSTWPKPVPLPPLPDPAAHGPAEPIASSGPATARPELEAELIEADAFARAEADRASTEERTRDFAAIEARWLAFARAAEGTGYASYAQTQLASIRAEWEREADRAYDAAVAATENSAGHRDWAGAIARAEGFVRAYPGSRAAALMASHAKGLEQRRRDWASAVVHMKCDFRVGKARLEEWVRTESPGLRVDGENFYYWNEDGFTPHVRLLTNWGSILQFDFPVREVGPAAWLHLVHVTATGGSGADRHSPIWIVVNGRILAGDWSGNSTMGDANRWDVTRYLVPGDNRIVIQLGDALTAYWLYAIEVSNQP